MGRYDCGIRIREMRVAGYEDGYEPREMHSACESLERHRHEFSPRASRKNTAPSSLLFAQ